MKLRELTDTMNSYEHITVKRVNYNDIIYDGIVHMRQTEIGNMLVSSITAIEKGKYFVTVLDKGE